MSDASVPTNVGTAVVDQSVVPYMRGKEVEFSAINLRPGRDAFFYFDSVLVTNFVQQASVIVTDSANTVMGYVKGEKLYCNATHAMASVIDCSPNNTIYLNENYISINVNAVGANVLGVSDYALGDLIYQTPTYTNPTSVNATFIGKVWYWNSSDKVLVVEPVKGTLNANNTANADAYLFKSGENKVIYAANTVTGDKFPVSSRVSSVDNVSNKFLTTTYTHRSGIVGSVNTPNANTIIISGTAPSDAVGNVMFLTSRTGLGQLGNVLSVSGNAVYTDHTFSPYPLSNTYYSIGYPTPDDNGMIAGVFNIPETQTVKFLTGEREFKITDTFLPDDADSTMVATGKYVAQGFIGFGERSTPIVQPQITAPVNAPPVNQISPSKREESSTPPVISSGAAPANTMAGAISSGVLGAASSLIFRVDPVAQTFFTPKPKDPKSNYGIFVSSIDLWFKNKPSADSPKFPVTVKIVTTENGYPTENVIASAIVPWVLVQTADVPDGANIGDLSAVNTTSTKFRFADPVYLLPASEYAILVYSESPDYEVFITELGQNDLTAGSTLRRISEQPNSGSFFRSQNSSTWTPYQNQDLMFVINKCVFDTSPVSFTFNVTPTERAVPIDEMILHSSDVIFPSSSIVYKIRPTLLNSLAQDSGYQVIVPDKFHSFGKDLTVSSSGANRRRVLLPGNSGCFQVQVTMDSDDPDVSPMFNAERLSMITYGNVIGAGMIDSEMITITDGGNHINANNITVTFSAPDDPLGTQATGNVVVLQGNSVPFVTVLNTGSGYYSNPTIVISEPGAPANATAYVAGEGSNFGGNGFSRYVTRKITLADGFDASDLRVYLNAVRPFGTSVEMYYKVISSTDSANFADKPWVRMSLVKDIKSVDQVSAVELQYSPSLGLNGLPGGNLAYTEDGITYPLGGKFKSFALKIVLFANDPTVVPKVLAMRAIAVPGG